jgi:3-hydroxyacyl-[acyl-carrier-protein] dehydratase
MTSRNDDELRLGPDVVQRLIPHRRPLLLVDAVQSYTSGTHPRLSAERYISASEPVFAGHYPGHSLWPGVYTIEGLGQATMLLEVLYTLERRAIERGASADELRRALGNLEHGCRLSPAFRPDGSALLSDLGELTPPLAMAGSVEMKFLAPVFAGCRLSYHVTRTQAVDDRFIRFAVEARVGGAPVARGTMTGVIASAPRA